MENQFPNKSITLLQIIGTVFYTDQDILDLLGCEIGLIFRIFLFTQKFLPPALPFLWHVILKCSALRLGALKLNILL